MVGREPEPRQFAGDRVYLTRDYYYEQVFRNGAPNMYPPPKHPVQGPLIDPALRKDAMLEWEIRQATKTNAERWSKREHRMMELFDFLDDCGHPNPEDDDQYDGDVIESLEDAVSKHRRWDLQTSGYVITDQAAYDAAVAARDSNPVYKAWSDAQNEWNDYHDTGVCKKNQRGGVCVACAELHGTGSEDFGYESHGCYLASDAADKYGDFWYANGEDDRPALTPA